MKITLGTINQYSDLDSGFTKLQVPWTIIDENGVALQEGNQSFDLTATADEIRQFATQTLATYQEDSARSQEVAQAQAVHEAAIVVADELSGFSVNT